MNTLVTLHDVTVSMGGLQALHAISLVLHEGEHTLVRGRNGSGKSTLLRVIRGELPADLRSSDGTPGGTVVWNTPDGPETFAAIGQRMSAMVSAAQLANYVGKGWRITGREVMLTGFLDTPLLYGEPDARQQEQVEELALQLGLTGLLDRELPDLSHGQVLSLLLARALVRRPKMLLLDECLDGLDEQMRDRVNVFLEKLSGFCTLIAVAHRADTLPGCMARIVTLDHGRIVEDRNVAGQKPARRARTLNDLAKGPEVQQTRASAVPPLVDIVHADVYVDGVHVLHDITWKICRGEQWAVIGHNGAGKSTLLRLLTGVENVALGGSIERRLPGQGDGVIIEMDRLRRGIGLVSDKIQATYWYDLSCEDLVCSGFERSVGLFFTPTAEQRRQAGIWMENLGVADLARRNMRSTSTGQLRRLMLARALVGRPDLVLLDEPFSGLDPEARQDMLERVNRLAESGVHFVLVTHHAEDIFPAITHVAFLDHGRMVRQCVLERGTGAAE